MAMTIGTINFRVVMRRPARGRVMTMSANPWTSIIPPPVTGSSPHESETTLTVSGAMDYCVWSGGDIGNTRTLGSLARTTSHLRQYPEVEIKMARHQR
jgi:hypothetical protein